MTDVVPIKRPSLQNLQLFGEYLVEGLIEQGTTWAVYRAVHLHRDNERYRVRVLQGVDATQRGIIEAFARMTYLLQSLRHPGIIPIALAGVDQGLVFVVHQDVPGMTLKQRLEGGLGALEPAEVTRIATETAAVLDYLHRHHPPVLLRSLEPSKIQLSQPDGAIRVLEVGYAHAIEEVHHVEPVPNRPRAPDGFRAPEEDSSGEITGAVDQYSLAQIVRRCLTLTKPGAPAVTLSPAVQVVLARGAHQDPTQRFPSAGEFARALTESLAHATSHASPAVQPTGAMTDAKPPAPAGAGTSPFRSPTRPAVEPASSAAGAAGAGAVGRPGANNPAGRRGTILGSPPVPAQSHTVGIPSLATSGAPDSDQPPAEKPAAPAKPASSSLGVGPVPATSTSVSVPAMAAVAAPAGPGPAIRKPTPAPPPPASPGVPPRRPTPVPLPMPSAIAGVAPRRPTPSTSGAAVFHSPTTPAANSGPPTDAAAKPAASAPTQPTDTHTAPAPAAAGRPVPRPTPRPGQLAAVSPPAAAGTATAPSPQASPPKPAAFFEDDVTNVKAPSNALIAATVRPDNSELIEISSADIAISETVRPPSLASAVASVASATATPSTPPSASPDAPSAQPPAPPSVPYATEPVVPTPAPGFEFSQAPTEVLDRSESAPASTPSSVRVAKILGVSIVLGALVHAGAVTLREPLMKLAFGTGTAAVSRAPSVVQPERPAPTPSPASTAPTPPVAVETPPAPAPSPATPPGPDTTATVPVAPPTPVIPAAGVEAPAPTARLPRRPAPEAQDAAEAQIVQRVDACQGHIGHHAYARVTYEGATGHVSELEITGHVLDGHPDVLTCVEAAIRAVALPPFASRTWDTRYTLMIR